MNEYVCIFIDMWMGVYVCIHASLNHPDPPVTPKTFSGPLQPVAGGVNYTSDADTLVLEVRISLLCVHAFDCYGAHHHCHHIPTAPM